MTTTVSGAASDARFFGETGLARVGGNVNTEIPCNLKGVKLFVSVVLFAAMLQS